MRDRDDLLVGHLLVRGKSANLFRAIGIGELVSKQIPIPDPDFRGLGCERKASLALTQRFSVFDRKGASLVRRLTRRGASASPPSLQSPTVRSRAETKPLATLAYELGSCG